MDDRIPNALTADLRGIRGNQAEEVRELCRQYGTSPDKLKEALRAVGYDGEKVRRYLNGERPG